MDKWTLQEEAFKRGYEKGKADAVVHGKWEEKQEQISWLEDDVDVFFECSICECLSDYSSPYCPNCGAKMDGDGNDI